MLNFNIEIIHGGRRLIARELFVAGHVVILIGWIEAACSPEVANGEGPIRGPSEPRRSHPHQVRANALQVAAVGEGPRADDRPQPRLAVPRRVYVGCDGFGRAGRLP